MLLTEWNWDDALQVRWEEGIEKDRNWIMSLLAQGKSADELKRIIESGPPL